MNERKTKIAINVFTIGVALFVPLSAYLKIGPFTPTVYAGFTLVMVYFAANPKLLNASKAEWKIIVHQGPAAPIALFLGIMLVIIGIVEAGVRFSAT